MKNYIGNKNRQLKFKFWNVNKPFEKDTKGICSKIDYFLVHDEYFKSDKMTFNLSSNSPGLILPQIVCSLVFFNLYWFTGILLVKKLAAPQPG